MSENECDVDAVIIGGGFYGSLIAIYLVRQRGFKKIVLLEQESELLTRASYNNQARVHSGYHYPRSFTTAYRSRINSPHFIRDWPQAVNQNFTSIYAIARRNSKITSKQFMRFCNQIGAKCELSNDMYERLFNPTLIEMAFLVEECVFDARVLAIWIDKELKACGVRIFFETKAEAIFNTNIGSLKIISKNKDGDSTAIVSRYVFNCTYSGLNHFGGEFPRLMTQLKHEITEMALIEAPSELRELGVTLMDGPFFSMMPFPARGLHSLSHVRYTPHEHWNDRCNVNPYEKLSSYSQVTRIDRMLRDVIRYMPSVRNAKYIESLFEVKTVLIKNEADDGRPILFERHASLPGCYSVLGGKIDNIYDILEMLDEEEF